MSFYGRRRKAGTAILLTCSVGLGLTGSVMAGEMISRQANEVAGLGLDQAEPVLASGVNGHKVAAWLDQRNGTFDVRAAILDEDGMPVGSSFQVNEDPERRIDEEQPALAVDAMGNFIVVWQEARGGDVDVFARRFDSMGNPLGSSFLVDDQGMGTDQENPDVACDDAGNFVIVWQHYDAGQFVFAKQFDNQGAPRGDSFRIDYTDEFALATEPAVAMSPQGAFTVAWIGVDIYFPEIFCRGFTADGTPLTDPIWISDDETDSDHARPDVAMSSDDHAVIVWQDSRDNFHQGVYGQLIGAGGMPQGVNFRIDEAVGGTYGMEPVIDMLPTGDAVIAWHDRLDGEYSIVAQWLDSNGSLVGSNTLIAEGGYPTVYQHPAAVLTPAGEAFFAWELQHYSAPRRYDLLTQGFDADRQPIGAPMQLNDDVDANSQTYASLATCANGDIIVAWQDQRFGNEDIFLRRFDAQGNPTQDEQLINDDGGDIIQRYPNVACNDSGAAVVAWIDRRVTYSDVFMQRLDADGNPIGPNTRVNDSDDGSQYGVDVEVAPDGSFLIMWHDSRYDFYDIFIQRYDADGDAIGGNVLVTPTPPNKSQTSGKMAMDAMGNFIVIWVQDDGIAFSWNVYGQRYHANGALNGGVFKVNDGSGSNVYRRDTGLDMAPDGSFTVAWRDDRHDEPVYYARSFDSAGNPLTNDFKVNDMGTANGYEDPCVAYEETGEMAIVWSDDRSGDQLLYVQRYDVDGDPVGAVQRVGEDLDEAVALGANAEYGAAGLVMAWEGNHLPDQGYDIWLCMEQADCPADVNGDAEVNIDDLFQTLGAWGSCDDCVEDVNEDGLVDIDDVFAVLADWGPCQ